MTQSFLDNWGLLKHIRCLFVIDLKIGRFKAEYKGQMELYLRWLEENERQVGENPPLGLILCAGKSTEQIRLLQLDKGRIRVAEYMTELPPRNILEKKLHQDIQSAREYCSIHKIDIDE
ncbi:MAG: PDDEXK nuclease domain-containing protein [Planctomycetota bacterium]|nr:PDDEXK nuclease domain-containing protein [Planctomycetota bacterium]